MPQANQINFCVFESVSAVITRLFHSLVVISGMITVFPSDTIFAVGWWVLR